MLLTSLKFEIKMFQRFIFTGFISFAYCCYVPLLTVVHQQPPYYTLRGKQISQTNIFLFSPDIKHPVSNLTTGLSDKKCFLGEKLIFMNFSLFWDFNFDMKSLLYP